MKDGAEGWNSACLKLATSAAGANSLIAACRVSGGENIEFYFPARLDSWEEECGGGINLSSAHKPQSENQLGLTDGTFGLSSLA